MQMKNNEYVMAIAKEVQTAAFKDGFQSGLILGLAFGLTLLILFGIYVAQV